MNITKINVRGIYDNTGEIIGFILYNPQSRSPVIYTCEKASEEQLEELLQDAKPIIQA